MNKPQVKKEQAKPSIKRVEVFTRKYCDAKGVMHSVGDVCNITDDVELANLTKNNVLKTIVKEG